MMLPIPLLSTTLTWCLIFTHTFNRYFYSPLSLLLLIEGILLSISYSGMLLLSSTSSDLSPLFLVLVVSVTASGMSLSFLVSITRTMASSSFLTTSMLW